MADQPTTRIEFMRQADQLGTCDEKKELHLHGYYCVGWQPVGQASDPLDHFSKAPASMEIDCPHKQLKRVNVGGQHWYRCIECMQKLKAEIWDGKVVVRQGESEGTMRTAGLVKWVSLLVLWLSFGYYASAMWTANFYGKFGASGIETKGSAARSSLTYFLGGPISALAAFCGCEYRPMWDWPKYLLSDYKKATE